MHLFSNKVEIRLTYGLIYGLTSFGSVAILLGFKIISKNQILYGNIYIFNFCNLTTEFMTSEKVTLLMLMLTKL